jgi:hypothetical protein
MRTGLDECRHAEVGDDFLAYLTSGRTAMAVCERLLDHPTDLDALAAARQLINDNPHWMASARRWLDSLPD